MGFWKKIAINSIVFIGLSYLMPTFFVQSVWTAFGASILLALMNILVKPILHLLSFPITLLTFGLFSFIINALVLWMTAALVGPSFSFAGFGTALIVSLALSLVQSLLNDRMQG